MGDKPMNVCPKCRRKIPAHAQGQYPDCSKPQKTVKRFQSTPTSEYGFGGDPLLSLFSEVGVKRLIEDVYGPGTTIWQLIQPRPGDHSIPPKHIVQSLQNAPQKKSLFFRRVRHAILQQLAQWVPGQDVEIVRTWA